MRRDTTVIYGSIIILTTIVVIGSFFAVIQLQYANKLNQTASTTTVVAEPVTDITSELVIVHLAVPVTVERFGVTLELTQHEKINQAAIVSVVTITTPETSTPTVLQFTGIGESQTTPDGYIVRLVNATASSAQILVGK